MTFDRSIDGQFLEALNQETAKGGWWADVLHDPSLLIAPRGKTLNVYWQGQSIFNITCRGGKLRVSTHQKYLINSDLAGQVALADGRFDIASMLQRALVDAYEGPVTLQKLKKAAGGSVMNSV